MWVLTSTVRPRANVPPEQAAALSKLVPPGMKSAVVTVDADDALFEEIFQHFTPDLIQLHGKEPPQRAADLTTRWKTPIIRAIPIETAADFDALKAYVGAADYFFSMPLHPKAPCFRAVMRPASTGSFCRDKALRSPGFFRAG